MSFDPSSLDSDAQATWTSVEAEAAEWLLREDRGLSETEQVQKNAWLNASPLHAEAFASLQAEWSAMNALEELKVENTADVLSGEATVGLPSETASQDSLRHKLLTWTPWVMFAAAACLVFAFWGLTSGHPDDTIQVLHLANTEAGLRSQGLPDGSVVCLDQGAELELRFTKELRELRLLQGSARFVVSKNPRRPFIVEAGGHRFRALGTVFDVCLKGKGVELLVSEGRVGVGESSHPVPAEQLPVVTRGQWLELVQSVEAEGAGENKRASAEPSAEQPSPVKLSDEELERRLNWTTSLLSFDSCPLSLVLEEFNRRNPGRLLVLDDKDLASLNLVASLRPDNVDGLVRLLEVSEGLEAEEHEGRLHLHRRHANVTKTP